MLEFVYPVTAMMSFGDSAPKEVKFESVEQWQQHIENELNGAMGQLSKKIVPTDCNKVHTAMFDSFMIEFRFKRSGQVYGTVKSQMHMPVPAQTMLQ